MNSGSTLLPSLPAPKAPIVRLIRPFQDFVANQAAGGLLLMASAAVALVWANSPWAASYDALWHTKFTIGFAGRELSQDLHFWVNDALMAIFFFVVGLEIKREVLVGELASVRQSVLPIVAALGGVVVPATIYTLLNAGGPGVRGWGIPMATDIAFVLGVLTLLGDRVPITLKVMMTALAIVDDLAAVIVIAIFYSTGLDTTALLVVAGLLLVSFGLNWLGVRHALPYALLGLAVWMATIQSGIHATVAGVLMAATIPARRVLDAVQFTAYTRAVLQSLENCTRDGKVIDSEGQLAAVEALQDACEKAQAPLQRLEHALQPWVMFTIMPLFALANGGVVLAGDLRSTVGSPITLGVLLGLLIGKPLGVMFASWAAIRTGFATLPAGVSWQQLHGAAWLAGIGFTMSLFVAALAFPGGEAQLNMAKLGILSASVLAGGVGTLLMLQAKRG